jgi:poly(hydroxyalkanoate) depolymerase family esterase
MTYINTKVYNTILFIRFLTQGGPFLLLLSDISDFYENNFIVFQWFACINMNPCELNVYNFPNLYCYNHGVLKAILPKTILLTFCLGLYTTMVLAQKPIAVRPFGSNPGNLRMFLYEPTGLDSTSPLVVVLHGCTQNAKRVGNQTGWNKLADKYGFRVLYPQQKIWNNPGNCFCWYKRSDIEKGKGEAESIHQMIEYVKANKAVDTAQVFITGLSAGAAMGVALMADYPQTFNAGAIFAGGPYKAATNIWTGMMAMYGWRVKKPHEWGNYVREQNTTYTGKYPRMIVYHGKMDVVVNRRNATEIVKQWTNLHGVSAEPTQIIKRFAGNKKIEKRIYGPVSDKPAVTYYRVKGMGHALPVNPGKCEQNGGKMGAFSADRNFYSTYWVAVDFGLIALPKIEGDSAVTKNAQGIKFSILNATNANYQWTVPKGCTIVSGQGTPTIVVNWNDKPGNVDVMEMQGGKCKRVLRTWRVEPK